MKGVKIIQKTKGSQAQDIQEMFGQIFHPQQDNIHIYLDKIFKLFVEYDKIYKQILPAINKSLFKQDTLSGFNSVDQSIFQEIEAIMKMIQEEIKSKVQSDKLDNMMILLYSETKNKLDMDQIEEMSNYLNGSIQETFPSNLQKYAANLFNIFKDIDNCKKESLIPYYQQKINNNQDEDFNMFGMQIAEYIRDSLIENNINKLECLTMSLKIFFKQQKLIYDILKIPEFNVDQLKTVIESAIREFKKNVPRCDLAFSKLLSSLDVFVNNFDKYYENFNSEGREPSILFVNFIDDVQQQYSNADTKECRNLLRQFKQIQQEFGKRLSSNLKNPMIKNLYEQLQNQMKKASNLINLDEDDEETKDHI